jgi:phospholipase C
MGAQAMYAISVRAMRLHWLARVTVALIAMLMAMPESFASEPLATTTTLASSLNPSVYGEAVTFTATVGSSSGTPTGTVTFIKNGNGMGTATLAGGVATLTTNAGTFAVMGSKSMTAAYSGDTNFRASTSPPLNQVVTQATSVIALTSSLNPSVYGRAVTLTATVGSSSGALAGTGTVTFIKNGTVMGTGALSGGVATFTTNNTTFAVIGTKAMTAAFSGDTNFSAGTSPALSQVVTLAPSSIALISSVNPSAFGQAVTYTATVSSSSGTPTGTIQFVKNGNSMGAATLTGGVATFTTTPTTFAEVGTKAMTAAYGGNTNFSAGTSPALSQVVNLAPSSLALTSSLNPSVYGQAVTFTATATSAFGTPSGPVTFFSGSAWISDAMLTGGVATVVTTGLGAGTGPATAVYGGSDVNSGSTSPVLGQVVTPATSTVILTSSPNPSTLGEAVTFTANVAPEFSGTPAGTITFISGTRTLGATALRAGAASLTTSALTSGALSINASFLPSNGFSASRGALTQKVNPAGTPGYELASAALNPVSVTAGKASTSVVTLTPANSYAGTVMLSCSISGGRTPAPVCSFNPSSLITSGSAATSVLTVSTSNMTPASSYTILITGSDANGLPPVNGPQTQALATATVIEHIVIIFQENRSTDNLFQDPVLIARGADIASTATDSQGQTIPLTSMDLGSSGANPANYDLGHSNEAFVAMYDGGRMDGTNPSCSPAANCPPRANPNFQYRYVDPADVQPYFALAEQYTFGDRMFQTNQGPSFPAHQFILSGTSAPTATSPLFAAGNPPVGSGGGCMAPPATLVTMIDAAGSETNPPPEYPCFEHPTLTDLLNARALTWRYYTPIAGNIWTAPDAIGHMCQQRTIDGTLTCTGPDWTHNVIIPQTQVLKDIANAQLTQVSWIIPTGLASDHPGSGNGNDGSGPSWVASIVNAIGNSAYWANTAIIITWDDWGGWYDHVAPPVINDGVSWGSGYVYGFRVPLIVVSPYAQAAYISHTTHDFGSILKFIETNFNLPSLDYADAYADDLSDCFNLTHTPLTFQTIPATLDVAFFLNDKRPPTAPDDD